MKVGIIGSGFVGSSAAYCLIMRGIASEVVLIDKDTKRAEAEALDISDATPNGYHNRIYSGDYKDLHGADVVIFTAGISRKPDQTRLDLLKINAGIMQDIVPQVVKYANDAIFLVASNPADIMMEVVLKLSNFDKSRVICSGTVLDSARFRMELSRFLEISTSDINAYVVGEHGDSQVLLWSNAQVATLNVSQFAKKHCRILSPEIMLDIDNNVRYGAAKIIEGKRATFYGIGGALSRICEAIALNANVILPVSSQHANVEGIDNVTLALPTVINNYCFEA